MQYSDMEKGKKWKKSRIIITVLFVASFLMIGLGVFFSFQGEGSFSSGKSDHFEISCKKLKEENHDVVCKTHEDVVYTHVKGSEIESGYHVDNVFVLDDEILVIFSHYEPLHDEERIKLVETGPKILKLFDMYGQEKWTASFKEMGNFVNYYYVEYAIKSGDKLYIFVDISKEGDKFTSEYLLTYDSKGELIGEEKIQSSDVEANTLIYLGKVGEDYYFDVNYMSSYLLGNVMKFHQGKFEMLPVDKEDLSDKKVEGNTLEEIADYLGYPQKSMSVISGNYIYSIDTAPFDNYDRYYLSKYELNGKWVESSFLFENEFFDPYNIFASDHKIYVRSYEEDTDTFYVFDTESLSGELIEDIHYDEDYWVNEVYFSNHKYVVNYMNESGDELIDVYDESMKKVSDYVFSRVGYYTEYDSIYSFGFFGDNLFMVSVHNDEFTGDDRLLLTYYDTKP